MPAPEQHTTQVYDYAIVRVVPRVEREEFINAGVILSCQSSGFLSAAIALDEPRLRALDPQIDLDTVHRHLAALVGAARHAAGQEGLEQLGKQRDDVEAHVGAAQ